jgi:hypothetical protein
VNVVKKKIRFVTPSHEIVQSGNENKLRKLKNGKWLKPLNNIA